MNYRTSDSICSLYGYLQEEACNELLDLSPWLNHGWPQAELRMTVLLLRRMIDSPGITHSELLAEGFPPSLLNKTLPFMSDEQTPLLCSCSSQASINHLYASRFPVMKVLIDSGYSLHRLSARWMRVISDSDGEILEWMMLKKNNQIVGWVLMPHI